MPVEARDREERAETSEKVEKVELVEKERPSGGHGRRAVVGEAEGEGE